MTSIEKGILAVIVIALVAWVGTAAYSLHLIEEAGGIKQVIIEVGKDIKDIQKEIN